jgi:hypothetical protein
MASFGEILAGFKGDEEPENIVPIIDDDVLQTGMIAWKSVRIRYKAATDCMEVDPTAKWEWLWDQIEYDQWAFGTVAGVNQKDVGGLLSRLKGLRLIYPDGTISKLAKQYLSTIIMSKLKAMTPRVAKPVAAVKPVVAPPVQ